MSNKELDDEAKQKVLMAQISKQLGYLAKLIFSIVVLIAPFGLIFLLETYFSQINSKALYQLKGIGVSIFAVVVYIIIKKQYVRLYKNRKNPS